MRRGNVGRALLDRRIIREEEESIAMGISATSSGGISNVLCKLSVLT